MQKPRPQSPIWFLPRLNRKQNEEMTLQQYIHNIDLRYRLGNATEHTFRGDYKDY
jgi:hypothetical protein